jgi:hypothetical protein
MIGAPSETGEVIARSAGVRLVEGAIGIDFAAEGEAVYHEIAIVARPHWAWDGLRFNPVRRGVAGMGAFVKEPSNSRVVGTYPVCGQLVGG